MVGVLRLEARKRGGLLLLFLSAICVVSCCVALCCLGRCLRFVQEQEWRVRKGVRKKLERGVDFEDTPSQLYCI